MAELHGINNVQYGIDLASPQEMIAHEKVSLDLSISFILPMKLWKDIPSYTMLIMERIRLERTSHN